jgi:hypothetical protein
MMSGFERYTKKTRRAAFLEEMEQVVPWRELCALVEPHYPKPENGRPPVSVERIHLVGSLCLALDTVGRRSHCLQGSNRGFYIPSDGAGRHSTFQCRRCRRSDLICRPWWSLQ